MGAAVTGAGVGSLAAPSQLTKDAATRASAPVEREAIVKRVSLAETRRQDEYIWRNEETTVKVRQVIGR